MESSTLDKHDPNNIFDGTLPHINEIKRLKINSMPMFLCILFTFFVKYRESSFIFNASCFIITIP